ncbi:Fic family protein [Methanolapillus ohkumae]
MSFESYIYEKKNWPSFTWNEGHLLPVLGRVRNLQGKLFGKMISLGFSLKADAVLLTLTLDVLKSSEIEGEYLNPDQVRSSVAKRLGIDIPEKMSSNRTVDGVVDMMLDATQNYQMQLTTDRLFSWHTSLFPAGKSGIYPITVGNWRKDEYGPMQIVSGPAGKQKVHFKAPDAANIPAEMEKFLNWLNHESGHESSHETNHKSGQKEMDPVIKAGVAHLWFVVIHPFDDGNGRVARAISDMLLARSDGSADRFYSMSTQILKERKMYYSVLENSKDLDITLWLEWFLNCLERALLSAESVLNQIFKKSEFWTIHKETLMNERQRLMINKLLDGFDGKLQTSKWAKIAKCSNDTALRDIQDLIEKGILIKEAARGRSTNYELAKF